MMKQLLLRAYSIAGQYASTVLAPMHARLVKLRSSEQVDDLLDMRESGMQVWNKCNILKDEEYKSLNLKQISKAFKDSH